MRQASYLNVILLSHTLFSWHFKLWERHLKSDGSRVMSAFHCIMKQVSEWKYSYTSFPLVSPFSIHSTVTLSLSSCSDVTIAWCIRPAVRVTQKEDVKSCLACSASGLTNTCCWRQTPTHAASLTEKIICKYFHAKINISSCFNCSF